ncbi:hypothetical protein ACFYNO_33860 [Kitasatospora sp. NPDC006697]|uniref:hypothetical protein n=1 Tax=Kitasatospora sp. NPDC006697 TaxID=3364020 RepID=UPI00367E419A
MRIRSLGVVTAALAAAAIAFAPAASADTVTTAPWANSFQTASASGTVTATTVNGTTTLVVKGTLTNTGSGCYELEVTNSLGGFFYGYVDAAGICGPGSVPVNQTVPTAVVSTVYLCATKSLTTTPISCTAYGNDTNIH